MRVATVYHPFSFRRSHFETIDPKHVGNSLGSRPGKLQILAFDANRTSVAGEVQRTGGTAISQIPQELVAGIRG